LKCLPPRCLCVALSKTRNTRCRLLSSFRAFTHSSRPPPPDSPCKGTAQPKAPLTPVLNPTKARVRLCIAMNVFTKRSEKSAVCCVGRAERTRTVRQACVLAKQMGMHAQVATRQRVGQAEARAVNDPALTSTPCVVRSCMMQWLCFSPLALDPWPRAVSQTGQLGAEPSTLQCFGHSVRERTGHLQALLSSLLPLPAAAARGAARGAAVSPHGEALTRLWSSHARPRQNALQERASPGRVRMLDYSYINVGPICSYRPPITRHTFADIYTLRPPQPSFVQPQQPQWRASSTRLRSSPAPTRART
jgi:hypothetical protein